MITAVVTGLVDPVTGDVTLNISFTGFEFLLGSVLGALAAVVVWSTLKSFAK